MHFEAHVRAAHGGGFNPAALKSTVYKDDEVSFLQASNLSEKSSRHATSLAGPYYKDLVTRPLIQSLSAWDFHCVTSQSTHHGLECPLDDTHITTPFRLPDEALTFAQPFIGLCMC